MDYLQGLTGNEKGRSIRIKAKGQSWNHRATLHNDDDQFRIKGEAKFLNFETTGLSIGTMK